MNLLCIDIGNTNIVLGTYNQDKLVSVNRIETNKNKLHENIHFKNMNSIAISSVVPEIENEIKNKLQSNYFSISHANSGIKLDVNYPDEVGNDRICNMKVAIKNNLYPAIIVDFGSATTYDVINSQGHFIGGAIAPGVDVSAENLFKKAAQLNKVNFELPKSVIGRDTVTNLQSGIMYAGIDSINGMLNRIKKEVKNEIKHIILTGGFSNILSKHIDHNHMLDPQMTIKGIKLIWEENQ
tara:strand:- start:228 stop:944 length:717 start_codon:yes stop_codon:yes gene_type:complete